MPRQFKKWLLLTVHHVSFMVWQFRMVLAAYLLPSNNVIILTHLDPPWPVPTLFLEKCLEMSEMARNQVFEKWPTWPTHLTHPNPNFKNSLEWSEMARNHVFGKWPNSPTCPNPPAWPSLTHTGNARRLKLNSRQLKLCGSMQLWILILFSELPRQLEKSRLFAKRLGFSWNAWFCLLPTTYIGSFMDCNQVVSSYWGTRCY